MYLITIITCTKNSAVFLPACIASIKSQYSDEVQHIFVDGESCDATQELVQAYAS